MLTPLDGKAAVVTGASKGIGKGIARLLARHGARVMAVARNPDEIAACAEELGSGARGFAADVSDPAQVQATADAAAEAFGGIDILVANAGIYPRGEIAEVGLAEWDRVLDVNLRGTFLCVQACLPWLKRSGAGRVVAISSITGPTTGDAGFSHYAASKAGQLGFVRSAAIELAPHGITVNAVLPGNTLTEGYGQPGEAELERMKACIPLRRLGTVEEMAHAVLFLASREAGYITGQTITVDGGQTLPEWPGGIGGG